MIEYDLDTDHSILLVRPKSALDSDDFDQLAKTVDPHIEATGDLAGLIIDAPGFPGWDSFGAMAPACHDDRMTATPAPSSQAPDENSALAGYPVTAPPPLPGPVIFDQLWTDLTFVHWPVLPNSVAHLYPPATRPDVFADGMTYVALVPFAMTGTKLGTALPLPYFGSFLETNIRLYSIGDAGRHGVLFRSLETARLAVVPVTRIGLGVPYTWARMRMTRSGNRITYDSVRRWPKRGLRSRLTIEIGGVVEPTPLEIWLTARWGAHSRQGGRTWWVPNEHETWSLHAAEIVELADELRDASGVRPGGQRLRALYSPGMRTRFGRRCRVE